MENLSSELTFFYKFIFTTVWPGLFGLLTLASFVSDKPELQKGRGVYVVCWLIGSTLLWRTFVRIKQVHLEGTTLVISNFSQEVRVPTAQLAQVSKGRIFGIRMMTLGLSEATPFGRSICFMRPVLWWRFSPDDLDERLLRLARQPPAGT